MAAAYTLGTWGWQLDGTGGKQFKAPVYEHGSNDLAYWVTVHQEVLPTSKLKLWRVTVTKGSEKVATALKDELVKARGWAHRWVEEQVA